jgi:hypothetical protein
MDDYLFTAIRQLAAETLEKKIQERINAAEKTAAAKQCPHCRKKTQICETKTKMITTSNNHIKIKRRYRRCNSCGKYSFPVEKIVGIEKNYTFGAKRLIGFAVTKSSYELAVMQLKEFGCFRISRQTISNLVPSLSDKVAGRLHNNAAIRKEFQEAEGDTEFGTDGAYINTRDADGNHCWQEYKIADFVKRKRGRSALPHEWDKRELPKPSVNMAIATMSKIEGFTEKCKAFRFNLGVGGGVTSLGDGARWIWILSPELFGNTAECLDIFHASEHISDCGKVLFSDEEKRTRWFEDKRMLLLHKGFDGVNRELVQEYKSGLYNEEQKKAVLSLQTFLFNNRSRMNYAERLREGRAIGSGVVEGACKNLVGRRMKQTGACWRVEKAEKLMVLCGVLYSGQWKHVWKSA